MAAITNSQVNDILLAYVEDYTKDRWVDVVRKYRHHMTADELFAKRLKTGSPSEKMTFNLKVNNADNTVSDSLFKKDTLNRVNLFGKGEVAWALQKTHFMVDRREPALMSGDKNRIYNYLNGQKSDMYDGFFEKNEIWLWTLPAAPNDGSNGDDPLVFGIPYWIVPPTTEALSLQGDKPSGYSTVANVNSANVPRWKNWGAKWSSMTNADFCKKLSSMLRKTNYKAPKEVKEEESISTDAVKLYSDEAPFVEYEDALYGSNENVGEDMGRWRAGNKNGTEDTHVFRGKVWREVPALTDDGPAKLSKSRVYVINWDTFYPETYGDLFMDISDPLTINNQHNTNATWMDSAWQLCCIARDRNGLMERI